MKITFFLSNRQSGKSHLASYEFLKDPEHNLLITLNRKNAEHFKFYKQNKNNIISCNSSEKFFCGKKYKKVILDEYLFFDINNRIRLYDILPQITKKILIFTSSSTLYNKDIFNFVKEYKQDVQINNISRTDISMLINKTGLERKIVINLVNDLICNFITDPCTNLIHDSYFFNRELIYRSGLKEQLSDTKYKLEVEGQYLEETKEKEQIYFNI
jgi:hypothetical protein